MKMRSLAITVAGLFLSCAGMLAGPNPAGVKVLNVTAIAETMEEGQKFTAVSIEYNEPFRAGAVTRASFEIKGRDVTRVYVNSSGKKGDVAYEGDHVVVELATSNVPGAGLGSTLYFGRMHDMQAKVNHRLPIEAVVTQTDDLKAISGNVAISQRLEITAEANLLADEFDSLSFTDPASGVTVKYRLYIPKGYRVKTDGLRNLPLVVFLHGSGERGSNNFSQLAGNRSAIEWVTPEAQAKHPSFVVAPQNPDVTKAWAANIGTAEAPNWAMTAPLAAVKKIIDLLLRTYNVDASRIYGTGLSQGSKGTMRLSIDYPNLYAAQLNSSGCDVYSDEEVARIARKPIWHLIAVDDSTNPSSNVRTLIQQLEKGGAKAVRNVGKEGWNAWLRGADSAALARALWDQSVREKANVLYTEYLPATVVPNTHWSWMATFSNETVRDWLFSQTNTTPYQSGDGPARSR
jgi:predicted peptidase